MSAVAAARDFEQGRRSQRSSPAPASPYLGQKRFRNGDPVHTNGTSGQQTPLRQGFVGSQERPHFAPDASIVLVGIRGCGKRSLGFIAAAALGRRFVTEDHYFHKVTGSSRQEYLRIHGSEEFHKQDVEASLRMLDDNRHGCVIDCGLGSLTRALQGHLKAYCQTNLVIYVQRDMDNIKQLLRLSDRSAKMLEMGDPSHRRCSNYEFFNIEDESGTDGDSNDDRASPTYSFKLRELQTDFSNFVRVITQSAATPSNAEVSAFSSNAPIESKLYTHALSLPVSMYRSGALDFAVLEAGGDIAEVKINEWQEGTARLVTRMLAEVRRRLRVPIMVSVTSTSEDFPVNVYFAAVRHALRLAPEFLMVDLTLEKDWIAEIASQSSCTRLVGLLRYRNAGILLKESDQAIGLLEKGLALGINLIRVSAHATTRSDGDRFDQLMRSLKHRYASRIWFSAYLTGPFGRTSQVFNQVLTCVTHESLRPELRLTMDVIPDITACEALRGLFTSFTLDPLHFFVFGANVASSLSLAMHNSAYKAVGLPHDYTAVNVDDWEDLRSRAQASDFGGASVAQPWKVKIVQKLSHMSEHARAIGAINTLIPLRGEHDHTRDTGDQAVYRNRSGFVFGFYGDNSDWLSIQTTLNKNLSPRNVIHSRTSALIVGAGGMARAACYALLQMGCRNICIYNRTISNAKILADHFMGWCASQNFVSAAQIKVIESTTEAWPQGFAQPTIIISCVTHERLPGEEHVADFTVPEQWLGSETGGAAVEQAYYINTPFIQQMKQVQASTGKPWVVVDGLTVLHAQATSQFEIMTARKPPRTVMWDALQLTVKERDGKV
ncbi:hypothetical protein PMZ80_000600 [Knufia obscura]|uniref:Quinate repressor protein n=1 Tax=Knufia obscura TaxID=1635080 RepID=A0ABR0S0R0_9EURO|nr:hypothetical protein PMZ80_000600 [Knufia obscura]